MSVLQLFNTHEQHFEFKKKVIQVARFVAQANLFRHTSLGKRAETVSLVVPLWSRMLPGDVKLIPATIHGPFESWAGDFRL